MAAVDRVIESVLVKPDVINSVYSRMRAMNTQQSTPGSQPQEERARPAPRTGTELQDYNWLAELVSGPSRTESMNLDRWIVAEDVFGIKRARLVDLTPFKDAHG